MADVKVFKDPIYGYIEVENDLIKKVIDKPAFQRLRRIIQTSYSPLYTSAIHNRFTHSLGVYYLGKIAINSIFQKKNTLFSNIPYVQKVFLYACLLHDVGHAPFSHTGEKFYLNPDRSKLHEQLINCVGDTDLRSDIPPTKGANPHEIMSAIVGITEFSELFSSPDEKDFFARAITGYHYKSHNVDNDIKNCFIDLLNSKYIDVDKLDYLMRDTYMTGFESVNIDYNRLLTSIDIFKDSNSSIHLVYEKNAISVIENVVYARDLEKKWIQIHPAVLYDIYLLEKSMIDLKSKLDIIGDTPEQCKYLFSYEALTSQGITLKDNTYIRLLSDDDLIYLTKNKYPNQYIEEYYDRNTRRHPLWKSESEYLSFFISSMTKDEQENFSNTMIKLASFLEKNGFDCINDEIIEFLNNEITETETLLQTQTSDNSNEQSYKTIIKDAKDYLKILEPLKSFSCENNIPFDYILLKNDLFYSAFSNDDFNEIEILFKKDDEKSIKKFKNIGSLDGKEKKLEKFYYLFYIRNQDNREFDIKKLVRAIKNKFSD